MAEEFTQTEGTKKKDFLQSVERVVTNSAFQVSDIPRFKQLVTKVKKICTSLAGGGVLVWVVSFGFVGEWAWQHKIIYLIYLQVPESFLQPLLRYIVSVLSLGLFLVDYLLNLYNDFLSFIVSWLGGPGPFRVNQPNYRSVIHPAVVVTGTSRGIGRVIALDLASRGYTVLATVRKKEHGDDVIDEFKKNYPDAGGQVIPVMLELADETSIAGAVREINVILRSLRLELAAVVNNAAVIVVEPFETVHMKDLKRSVQVNGVGTSCFTQRFLPLLKQSRGRIINVGSIAAWLPGPCFGQYCSSKAMIGAQTMVQRLELARHGIAVSLVEPGAFRTPAWDLGLSTLVTTLKEAEGMCAGADTTGAHVVPHRPLDQENRKMILNVSRAMRFARMVSFPPSHVAMNVRHALTSPYPKSNYLVGWDARLIGFLLPIVGFRTFEFVARWLF